MVKVLSIFTLALLSLYGLPGQAQVRQYYLAAEEEIWDFAPSGQNLVHCYPDPAPCPLPEPWRDNHRFPVTRFVQYANASFTTRVLQPEWLGILGPILRAEVGDEIRVRLCNRSQRPVSLHPHGLRYAKDHEGRITLGSTPARIQGLGQRCCPVSALTMSG